MSDFELSGKFELLGVGRGKVTRIVEVKNDREFGVEVSKHLMSRDISWVFDTEKNDGEIFVGGFRSVGKFRKL